MITRLAFVIMFVLPSVTTAEYRVFKLQITNSKNQNVRQIQSTLDPEQYRMLYPVNADEYVTYVQTWLCPGNTNHFKAHCNPPETNLANGPELNP